MKEGPTVVEAKGTSYRRGHGFNTVFTSEDFWFTRKGKYVYVISLVPPVRGMAEVAALYDHHKDIRNISLLGGEGSLHYSVSGEKLAIRVPQPQNTRLPGFVLKVELE